MDAAVQQPPGSAADAQLAGVLQLADRHGEDSWALRTRFLAGQLAAHDLPSSTEQAKHANHLRQRPAPGLEALQVHRPAVTVLVQRACMCAYAQAHGFTLRAPSCISWPAASPHLTRPWKHSAFQIQPALQSCCRLETRYHPHLLLLQAVLPRVAPGHNGSLAAWCQLAAACMDKDAHVEALTACSSISRSWAQHGLDAPAVLFMGPLISEASSSPAGRHGTLDSDAATAALDRVLQPGSAGGLQRDLSLLLERALALAAATGSPAAATLDPLLVWLILACRLLQPPLPSVQVPPTHVAGSAPVPLGTRRLSV